MATVRQGDTLVFVGDSITFQGWMDGAVAEIDAAIPSRRVGAGSATGARGIVSGAAASATPTVLPAVTAINSGVSKNQAADIAADVPGRILQYGPTHVIVQVGLNDAVPPDPPFIPTTLVSFRASYDSILAAIVAANPAITITCLSILVYQEQWTMSGGVPVWDNDFDPPPSAPGYTPSIAEFNAQIQASCVAHGGTFVDLRPTALAYEVANNLPEPGAEVGPLTLDGKHPTTIGKQLMSDLYMDTVTIVP